MNPFITSGYVSAEHFCNREKETKKLRTAIENNSKITLISIRRMGKTGLIKHVYNMLENRKTNLIYTDISHTNNLADFIEVISNAILKKFRSKPEIFFKELGSLLRNIRPVMKFDERTGEPQASLTFVSDKEPQHTLESIFDYLNVQSKNKRICLAIDEFQQITDYPEKNTEALLRSYIQHLTGVAFVFSGSKNKIMQNIFFNAKRPFYQSTEPVFLKKIEHIKYYNFIKNNFENNSISIPEDIINLILEWTCLHTYYVQYFCYKLFDISLNTVTIDDFHNTCDIILEEHESTYLNYKNILTEQQWNFLKAVAKESSVNKPMAIDFIKKYSLPGSSTISYMLKKLIEFDMIYEENSSYYVYDVFFSRWLERL